MSEKSADYWKWITAHEIAHMYWGFYVRDGEKTSWSQLGWLTLGLGLYLDRQFVEEKDLNFRIHENLVAAFREAEKEGLPVSLKMAENEIRNMSFDYNTVVLHGRSFYIIDSIAEYIGRSKFDAVLKEVLIEYAHREISFPLFREFITTRTEKDIGFLVGEYTAP